VKTRPVRRVFAGERPAQLFVPTTEKFSENADLIAEHVICPLKRFLRDLVLI
jgi:hypothetical protein